MTFWTTHNFSHIKYHVITLTNILDLWLGFLHNSCWVFVFFVVFSFFVFCLGIRRSQLFLLCVRIIFYVMRYLTGDGIGNEKEMKDETKEKDDTGFLEESLLLKHKFYDCRVLIKFITDSLAQSNNNNNNNNKKKENNNDNCNINSHNYFDLKRQEFTMFKNFTMKEFSILKHWLKYDNLDIIGMSDCDLPRLQEMGTLFCMENFLTAIKLKHRYQLYRLNNPNEDKH